MVEYATPKLFWLGWRWYRWKGWVWNEFKFITPFLHAGTHLCRGLAHFLHRLLQRFLWPVNRYLGLFACIIVVWKLDGKMTTPPCPKVRFEWRTMFLSVCMLSVYDFGNIWREKTKILGTRCITSRDYFSTARKKNLTFSRDCTWKKVRLFLLVYSLMLPSCTHHISQGGPIRSLPDVCF